MSSKRQSAPPPPPATGTQSTTATCDCVFDIKGNQVHTCTAASHTPQPVVAPERNNAMRDAALGYIGSQFDDK
ncbi:hypothetical protein ACJQWK_00254 [Exserohilum turcicum]|uniref:Uncharacterized protein n=1 Tax=Exserohilum turcicum (strain 28A) TaxID=671987 RepID=R0K1F6_EXST2|nr:uncharacterized protein SETTUDRAFT_22198 [Exserohilum turcica Et28A]EOA83499.1 hypothetical protein SETTUDRAFT_22198 [Exserohilum turcica Et28A]